MPNKYTKNTLFYLLSDNINKQVIPFLSILLTRKIKRCYYLQVKWLSLSQCAILDYLHRFFSVLLGSSLGLPALQRTGRQYYQQPTGQYYQQTAYNQYPSKNQDWSSSSSSSYPNVRINGNFNNDICNSQDKFFGLDSLLDVGKIRVLNFHLFVSWAFLEMTEKSRQF